MRIPLSFLAFIVVCVTARRARWPFANTATSAQTNNVAPSKYSWNETTFTTRLDHFSITDLRNFTIKLLTNMDSYVAGGPIFFYTGNEGDIEGFAEATGMMWDLAPTFNAALIFAEHRYYGASQPFGSYNESYKSTDNLAYLSTSQALADYAALLTAYKGDGVNGVTFPATTKVISFGGSYGGMLSAWFRLKYPHIIDGAWASSAPLAYFRGGNVDYGGFDKITTSTFEKSGCDNAIIANFWDTLRTLANDTDGCNYLNDVFSVDKKSLIKKSEDAEGLILYIREAIEYMAMVDYPYPTSFLTPMPAWPAKEACKYVPKNSGLTAPRDIAAAMAKFTEVYYNYANSTDYTACFTAGCGDAATAALGSPLGWPWQECTEVVIEMCSRGGDNDFFWNECAVSPKDTMLQYCALDDAFGKIGWTNDMLDELAIPREYGLTFETATNIIMTNGELDPWRAGGISVADKNRRLYAITVLKSAHHLDLRQPNTCDPSNLAKIRYQAVAILRCWIDSTKCTDKLDIVNSLPEVPQHQECKDIFFGYPWGVSDADFDNAATLAFSINSLLILLASIFFGQVN